MSQQAGPIEARRVMWTQNVVESDTSARRSSNGGCGPHERRRSTTTVRGGSDFELTYLPPHVDDFLTRNVVYRMRQKQNVPTQKSRCLYTYL